MNVNGFVKKFVTQVKLTKKIKKTNLHQPKKNHMIKFEKKKIQGHKTVIPGYASYH